MNAYDQAYAYTEDRKRKKKEISLRSIATRPALERAHIDEIYGLVAKGLAANVEKESIATIDKDGNFIVCHILASLMRFDVVLNYLRVNITQYDDYEPFDSYKRYIISFPDKKVEEYVRYHILKYMDE